MSGEIKIRPSRGCVFAGQVRSGQVRFRSFQISSGIVRSVQVMPGQVRSCHVKTGHVRSEEGQVRSR